MTVRFSGRYSFRSTDITEIFREDIHSGPQISRDIILKLFSFQVIIYEITRLKSRHKRLREVLLPAQAQSLDVFSEGRLCVGYQSGFTIYSLLGDQHPLSLVHPDNQVCKCISQITDN